MLSVLLAVVRVTSGFLSQMAIKLGLERIFVVVSLNKLLNKQSGAS